MKKLLFFILIVSLVSCKKDESVPVISGDWDVTFIATEETGANTYTGVMSLVQDGENLTGTLTYGGEERPLLSTSKISDVITIYCENLLFVGEIKSNNDLMEGDLYNYDIFDGLYSEYGTWQATKK